MVDTEKVYVPVFSAGTIGHIPVVMSRQCVRCRHKLGELACNAFDVIPMQILTGKHDHTKPYPNDQEIRFEPIRKVE